MPVKVTKRLDITASIAKEIVTKVGYPEETTGRDTYTNGLTLAANAAIQTMGSPGNRLFNGALAPIPPRDFMGQGAADWRADWIKRGAAQAYVKSITAQSPELFGEAVGISLQGFIREAFTSGNWEANKPFTIRQKGSSQPLIDDGTLRQGVDYISEVTA